MEKIIHLGEFTLTSTWQVVGPTPEGYKKTTPSIGSATLTLDLSSLPTGAIVNSATLYVEREWGDTGAALDTVNDSKWDVDYGGWTASEDISSLVRANIGGAAYLTFKYKAKGHTNPPTGTKRSSLHYKITKVTIDYTSASSAGHLNKSSVQMNGTDTITLSVSPTGSTATHKAKWSVGGQGLITHDLSGLLDTLTVPDSWNNYCVNGTSATAQVVLETYLNGTLTGSKAYNFTVIVPSNIVPSLTPSISAIGAFEGHNLKGKTQAKITPNASGARGSSIVSVAFSGAGQTGSSTGGAWTSNPISSTGTHAFTVTAIDSRGRTATKQVSFSVEDYALPYIQILACHRTNGAGQLDSLGTKGFFKAKYGVHAIGNNKISAVTAKLFAPDGTKLYDSSSWAKGTTEKTDSTDFGLTLDITKKYRIEFGVTDSVGSTSSLTAFIEKGASNLFDFKPDRAGIGCLSNKAKTLRLPDDWTVEGGGLSNAISAAASMAAQAAAKANAAQSALGGFEIKQSNGIALVRDADWFRFSGAWSWNMEYKTPFSFQDKPIYYRDLRIYAKGSGRSETAVSGASKIIWLHGIALYAGSYYYLPRIFATQSMCVYLNSVDNHIFIDFPTSSYGASPECRIRVYYIK